MADPTTFAYVILKAIQDRIMLTQAAILQFSEQEIKDALHSSEEE